MPIDIGYDAEGDVGLSKYASTGWVDKLPSEYAQPWPPVTQTHYDLYRTTVEAHAADSVRALEATAVVEHRKRHPDGIGAIPGMPSLPQVERALKAEARKRGVPLSRKQVEQQATAAIKREAARRGVPTSTRQLRRQAERLAKKEGAKLLKGAAKQLGVGAAQKLIQDTYRKMGVPGNIPVQIPTDATPEAVANAAISTGMKYTENLLRQKTGLPISFPPKLTAAAIGKSITGVFPTDVNQAIDLGLAIGAQYASAAITSALVGAGIGSVVPGLGTIVGIGVALGVEALKDALKAKPTPGQRKCKTPWECKVPQLDSMMLIPWTASEQLRVSTALATEQSQRMCGVGPIVTCSAWLSTLSQDAFKIAKTTVPVLGLPQIQKLIPVYEQAPKAVPYFDKKRKQIVQSGTRSTKDVKLLLPAMYARRTQLLALVAKASAVERLPPRDISGLRVSLVTELTRAAVQLQFQPIAENRQWLAELGQFFRRLEARRAGKAAERKQQYEKATRRTEEITADPLLARQQKLEQLQFRCGQDDERACAEWRKLNASPVPKGAPPAPRPRPRPTPSVEQGCKAMLTDWASKNMAQARCLSDADKIQMINVCRQAFGPKTITLQAALQKLQAIAAAACARKGRAMASPPTTPPRPRLAPTTLPGPVPTAPPAPRGSLLQRLRARRAQRR